MNVDIAELLADQIREEQRLHRDSEFDKSQVFKDLESSLKDMHLYLTGDFPSYTSEKIRMFSQNEAEMQVTKNQIKRRVQHALRRSNTRSEDEHTS